MVADDSDRVRLDVLLVARGLTASRESARRAVLAGLVLVDGRPCLKSAQRFDQSAQVAMADLADVPDAASRAEAAGLDFVSRAGAKLDGALDDLVDPESGATVAVRGRRALDVGASTGGFTEVLIARGAAAVVALDVGHGQLHPRVARDSRVTNLEGFNARSLTAADLPYVPDLVVGDVSFISWSLLLPAVVAVAPGANFVLMVKPQFEVGRELLPRDGVVRDPLHREQALSSVIDSARACGLGVVARTPSRLPGGRGNVEEFVWLRAGGLIASQAPTG